MELNIYCEVIWSWIWSSTLPKAAGAKTNSSNNADLPLISNIYSGFFEHPHASNWEQIHDADSFSFTKNDEPSQPFRFDNQINLEFRASSLSLPLVVSWIFQPCPIIGCIELNNLVSQIEWKKKFNFNSSQDWKIRHCRWNSVYEHNNQKGSILASEFVDPWHHSHSG